MASQKSSRRFVIGPGRLSFPHVFEPNAREFGGKYQVTLLLPPEYDFGPLKQAMKEAAIEKFGPDQSKWPRGMRGPKDIIRPCEEKSHLTGYAPGWHFITAASVDRPGVVDSLLQEVTDPREVYAGRWAMISVNVYAFSNVKHGVTLGLQNIQLRQHDDPFTKRVRPQDEFEQYLEDATEGWAATADSDTAASVTDAAETDGWDD